MTSVTTNLCSVQKSLKTIEKGIFLKETLPFSPIFIIIYSS